jgi:Domain of unknown function (DUF4276)
MPTFAVLAEDRSDADSLVVLVRRICGRPNATVVSKGFSGCGELCRKAASHILNFADRGATHFIICHDADESDPQEIRAKVQTAIKNRIPSDFLYCIVVPVQELEAWIIADEEAIKKAIPTFELKAVSRPETVASPKEWLVKESRRGRSRPLYVPTIHNAKVAQHIDLDRLDKKCPSFRPLKEFVSPPSINPA